MITCEVCGRKLPPGSVVPIEMIRESMTETIRKAHPEWPGTGYICLEDLDRLRMEHVQGPMIMMSQNRQESKDRLRAEHDYSVNLKAELEIRALNGKMDELITHQWQRLLEIQQIQMDLLAERRGSAGRVGESKTSQDPQ